MIQNSQEHFQMLALGAAASIALVMFVVSYAFFKTKRRPRLHYGGGIGLIGMCMVVSFALSRLLHVTGLLPDSFSCLALINIFGLSSLKIARLHAWKKHPEAIYYVNK